VIGKRVVTPIAKPKNARTNPNRPNSLARTLATTIWSQSPLSQEALLHAYRYHSLKPRVQPNSGNTDQGDLFCSRIMQREERKQETPIYSSDVLHRVLQPRRVIVIESKKKRTAMPQP